MNAYQAGRVLQVASGASDSTFPLAQAAFAHTARRKIFSGLTLLLLALASPAARAADKVTICHGATAAALVPIARQQGYFSAEGLDVETRRKASGRIALEAMFSGECALATVAKNPVAHLALARNDFVVVAGIANTQDQERIIARIDRGIRIPGDLRGRVVAVPEFTTAHYFLDIWLRANGMSLKDITPRFLSPDDVLAAYRRGEVDAAAQWQPNIQMLARESAAKSTVFTVPGLHTSPLLLVAGRDFVRRNPAIIERILRALLRAESFVRAEPAKARDLIARMFDVQAGDIEAVAQQHEFRVSLDQSLLLVLESAARWENGLRPTPAQSPEPDFMTMFYLNGLLAVKPAAVTIIR